MSGACRPGTFIASRALSAPLRPSSCPSASASVGDRRADSRGQLELQKGRKNYRARGREEFKSNQCVANKLNSARNDRAAYLDPYNDAINSKHKIVAIRERSIEKPFTIECKKFRPICMQRRSLTRAIGLFSRFRFFLQVA